MRSLNLPTYSFKIKSVEGKEYIYDSFRNKFLFLTPEEWVRQNFACFLVNEYSYPRGRMVLEKSLKYNNLSKRCDILVYDEAGDPVLMVECKAPGIRINASVFDQIAIYNMSFKVEYLIVTNGLSHYCAKVDFEEAKINFLKEIPAYRDISNTQ